MSEELSVELQELIAGDPRLLRSIEPFMAMEKNCIQVTLMPYIEKYPEETQQLLLDMTGELGGGIADQGYVCGGLLGGIMALSRELAERGYGPEERQPVLDGFVHDFSARYHSPFCSGVTGRDRGTEKAYEACRVLIVETILKVDELLEEADQPEG